jgi:PTH1 family peptidyl-tRNA hydrolase
MKIIVGLGNPGDKYKNTRHNAGFIAVDALARQLGLIWQKNKKFNADIAKYQGGLASKLEAKPRGEDIILVKPHTYMNNSGQAVQAVLSYYKLSPKRFGFLKFKKSHELDKILTVIHDDIDIVLGKYKVSIGSGSAGHNGVQSIINHLKTKNFKRVRIGIRTPEKTHIPTEKFVLQKFNSKELSIVNKLIPEIIEELK